MLSLQEFGGETVQDRTARRRAQDLLAGLAVLHRMLLGDPGDTETLRRLADLAEAVPAASDPGLAAIVASIVLRARVELARRQTEHRET